MSEVTFPCATTRIWKPLDALYKQSNYANSGILLLNVALKKNMRHLHRMWNFSPLRLVLDGAANHFYDNSLMPSGEKQMAMPHIISGDFDSVKSDVLDYYKSHNVDVVHTPDQDETDFTKGLRIISERVAQSPSPIETLVVFGFNCGRFDQIMACIHTLFLAKDFLPSIPLFLVHGNSLAFLLQPGKNEILLNKKMEGQPCGLIPIGCSAESVSTTGLKWNLTEGRLAFGDLVSTSNTYDFSVSTSVTVQTDVPLLWTMEIMERDQH